ncbi:MAG: VOC family protein [Pseudomonadota bacterium]
MAEDIFVPKSSAEDALVGPLHTVTYVTSDKSTVEQIFTQGYGLARSGWMAPTPDQQRYLGFEGTGDIEICAFNKVGEGANIQTRVIYVNEGAPEVRPAYDGLYTGGATLSFPMHDMRAHEKVMAGIGVHSTIGVKEMEFTSPAGETYISAEIVYKAPEHVFVMGVTRPDIFVPTGPIDPATGVGGPSYSARCMNVADETVDFFRDVLGYEIRRDAQFEVGERSALLMPEGTKERFVQGFAPGASTGYVVLMHHGEATKHSPAPGFGPPNRGIGMWSFAAPDVAAVYDRAKAFGLSDVTAPTVMQSPFLPETKTLLMKDPDGFPIEVFEA